MRAVQLSTETYAAIWADRQAGEESEDAIIARRFGVKAKPATASPERDFRVTTGFHDPRFEFVVPPGFEIFRVFKGKKYTAQAVSGFWISNHNGIGYPSLNELSKAIGAGTENAWRAWFYMDDDGARRPVDDMRKPGTINKRKP